MDQPTDSKLDILVLFFLFMQFHITKTRLFKFIENFTTKKRKIFR